jgi:hypothetical protein
MKRAQTSAAIGVEFSANNIRNALEIFGEMTGRHSSEAMLDSLFSTFCVGKWPTVLYRCVYLLWQLKPCHWPIAECRLGC